MKINKLEIIKRFFAGNSSLAELKSLFFWLNSEKGNQEISHSLDQEWNNFKVEDLIPIDSPKILSNIKTQIGKKNEVPVYSFFRKLLPYAAVFVVAIAISALIFNQQWLSGKLNMHSGLAKVLVENGQRSKLILPDSSVVWVNSGTSISYDYHSNKREIFLEGQAFFQVTKNKKAPFLVHGKDLIVRVLGTEFDVEAYPESKDVAVVLQSGSVQLLHQKNKSFNYHLNPGEIANFDSGSNKLVTSKANIQKLTSWKDGTLIFKNDPMNKVIAKLEHWYNIKIEVKDESVYNSVFTATIKNESYQQILDLINYSCPVHCQVINSNERHSTPHIIITKK